MLFQIDDFEIEERFCNQGIGYIVYINKLHISISNYNFVVKRGAYAITSSSTWI